MDKITVTSTESTLAASTLKDRCILCNGINGHRGTCPTIYPAINTTEVFVPNYYDTFNIENK